MNDLTSLSQSKYQPVPLEHLFKPPANSRERAKELVTGLQDEICKGLEEVGRRGDTGDVGIKIDQRYFRLTEVDTLLGDPSKASESLGWKPKTSLEQLVEEMIIHDREESRKEAFLKKQGFKVVSPK